MLFVAVGTLDDNRWHRSATCPLSLFVSRPLRSVVAPWRLAGFNTAIMLLVAEAAVILMLMFFLYLIYTLMYSRIELTDTLLKMARNNSNRLMWNNSCVVDFKTACLYSDSVHKRR